MANKFNGFLDNIATGALSPKGNLADWQHASRLFNDNNFKLAPKVKFLYHVAFTLDPVARSIIPDLTDKHSLEIGMLVKTADLPKYSAQTVTKNKYNRKKNVITSLSYDPVNIAFHDDNYGVTTALLEAYYRYYFRDGNYGASPGAYNRAGTGDSTYRGSGLNQNRYGLDNDQSVHFIQNIQISTLSRKTYTTYTLINPIITNWNHDNVDASSSGDTMQNSITVAYEAVHYSRGNVEIGANGNPKGFGSTEHYDTTPSPISLQGGGVLGLGGIFGAGIDLYEYITQGKNFNNPLQAGLAAANLFGNIRNLSSEGLRQEGFGLLTDAIGSAAGIDVSGVAQTFFPKNGGNGGAGTVVAATAAIAALSSLSNPSSPAEVESAAKQAHQKDFFANGGTGGINGANAAYNALPDSAKQGYRDGVTGT